MNETNLANSLRNKTTKILENMKTIFNSDKDVSFNFLMTSEEFNNFLNLFAPDEILKAGIEGYEEDIGYVLNPTPNDPVCTYYFLLTDNGKLILIDAGYYTDCEYKVGIGSTTTDTDFKIKIEGRKYFNIMDLEGYSHFKVLAFPDVLRLRGKMLRNVITPININDILERNAEENLNHSCSLKRTR